MQTLNPIWQLATDPHNAGRIDRWFDAIRSEAQPAPVPGVIQQVFPDYYGIAWYWQTFELAEVSVPGEHVLLRFGAVDYLADVWLNGQWVGSYEGGETPFEFDVTALVHPTSGDDNSNLLAVRVLNPTNERIDGMILQETPHRNKTMNIRPGSSFNSGGIIYPVTVRHVPAIYIDDIFARPDSKTGIIALTVQVNNVGAAAFTVVKLTASVSAAAGGDTLQTAQITVQVPPGASEHALDLSIFQVHLWDLDDPFLYLVTVTVTTEAPAAHTRTIRCGFRELRLIDGYFHLNGKRLFLKSTHTGNHMPIGQIAPLIPDLVRRDLLYAKASGFNTVRFIAGVGYPDQLDFCDEIGLMVWEGCFAGWCMADSPQMTERFDRNTTAMIRRDRNHPSLTIWELLNETDDGPVFRHAVTVLPKVRELDPSRLVLLSSGRWDGDWRIGSASNPSGSVWEPVWGVEGPDAPLPQNVNALQTRGYAENAGDAHYYPRAPQTPEANDKIRRFGHGQKPVLLSEYGIGSLPNVTREARHFEQVGARPDLKDAAALERQSVWLAADWARLGFEGVYPFAEDLLRESQRLHARQRTLGFNLVRSNPQLCGFNLTGMLDHALTGEGLWSLWREWKPATFDAVADGWSPLRWCLFADPTHAYTDRSITVEAVLANEGVLQPGEYPARFRIVGPHGIAWEKTVSVSVPNPSPLAIPVLRETLTLADPTGEYTFAVTLERGGAPTGGRMTIHASNPADWSLLSGDAWLYGIDAHTEAWLTARGLHCHPFTGQDVADLVLVGKPAGPDVDTQTWAALTRRLAEGATVLCLSAAPFLNNQAAMDWLPVQNKGRCYAFHDWLYHKECVANRHPVFSGMQAPGIMDWDYYGPVIPEYIFEGQNTPAETIAAAFAVGHNDIASGYACGLLIARYTHGTGNLILNTPLILENLDQHPAADRLLMNLIQYAQTLG